MTRNSGNWVQVDRLGNPLVNEVIIPTGIKDLWNSYQPWSESKFKQYYTSPILAAVINKLYKLGAPETGRDDLVAVLLTGVPKLNYTGPKLADVLRLNLSIPVTASPNRMGVLAGDNQGWPNGRRLGDDVIDIAEQAVGGFLKGRSSRSATASTPTTRSCSASFPYAADPKSGFANTKGDQNPDDAGGAGTASRPSGRHRTVRRRGEPRSADIRRPTTPHEHAEETMRRRAILVAGRSRSCSALGSLFGGVLGESSGSGAAPSSARGDAARDWRRLPLGGDTVATVARLEAAVQRDPPTPSRSTLLGLAYGQRWRETGDAVVLPLRGALGGRRTRPARRRLTSRARRARADRHDFRARARARSHGHAPRARTPPTRTASSATRCRARPLPAGIRRRSSGWSISSRASPPTPASRTRAS